MPEMTFTVRWPDGSVEACYSPSLVMHDHLEVGNTYPVADFVDRADRGLEIAASRVRARFGFECSSAADQRRSISRRAARFSDPGAIVEVLHMEPPLPAAAAKEPAEPGQGRS
jgi:uncharacterized repeat protein (TIGR04042 family)